MLVQNPSYLILIFVGIIVSTNQALATSSCRVYPSEYAYEDDSVTRDERASANCRRYPEISGLPASLRSIDFTHCDGTQLKLADTNLGSEQFSSSNHYQWSAGSDEQLLFIFPTRVSLTTITLHYYSDSVRGRPRLRFYAVRNDFDIWDTPTLNTPRVDVASVPPSGVDRRNVSVNFNFNTTKVLMYKYSAIFQFAVSEVDFFNCTLPTGTTSTAATEISTLSESTSQATNVITKSTKGKYPQTDSTTTKPPSKTMSTTPNFIADMEILKDQSNSVTEIIAIIVVSLVVLLVLSVGLIIIVVALVYKRKGVQKKFYIDSSYSTLNRGTGQQIQPQSLQQDSTQLYDQIHLSPSTGQAEYIPKSETANANNTSQISQNFDPTYSTAGGDIAEHSSALNTGNQATTSQLSPQNTHESTSEQPTYAAVDTSKKKNFKLKEDAKCKAAEKGPPVLPYSGTSMQEKKENATKQEITSPHTIEQLYTAVKKKPKIGEPKGEEETPPIPQMHTVEELYTNPKCRSNADSNKDEAPPPHTVEETQTAGEKLSQSATEDLYTAVTKKPKDASIDDTQTAPPIPPHTVEELYTAIMKKPNSGAEDEGEAPPIPPYTATLS